MSDDESDDVRAWEARQAALRPIEDQIDLMVTAFTRTLGTIKMSWPERKACYPVVLEHVWRIISSTMAGCLPAWSRSRRRENTIGLTSALARSSSIATQ